MNSIGYDICRTAREIHQHLSFKFKNYDVTPEQWVVLKELFEEDKISQKELSLRVDKDPNTIKAIVDKLEKKGYVNRQKNPSDQRAFLLTLTRSAFELIKQLDPLDENMIANISENFTEEDLKIFRTMLSKVNRNLKNICDK
ncbi:MarR family winged helix-turn-helix transcriptional regulator [Sulfurospirillum arcachonense]|uniref:MarR family winged helix-turn-helix transcriptional regulator n=1 Tax=Sulfurospirillum arcachonense TaxID=57666 RepID=UPI0004BA03DA|nr:MarR family transcriptional regulator [Sulfurospirillum arcachonense]